MTGQPDVRFTLALGAISIVVMTIAPLLGARWLSMVAAAVFTLSLIWTALRTNARLAALHNGEIGNTSAGQSAEAAVAAGRLNAQLMALAYGWGGAAMLAIYHLSGLSWQHGWQYGLGMIAIASGLMLYARQISGPAAPVATMRWLEVTALMAMAQAVAAGIALVLLTMSGKLQTPRDDWAANHIFVAGGIAVVVLSVIAVVAHRRSTRRQSTAP